MVPAFEELSSVGRSLWQMSKRAMCGERAPPVAKVMRKEA